VQLAHRCKNPASKFTNLIAAIYPARAIAELMIEAAKKQELPSLKNRKEMEEVIIPKLPYYKLIYRIRIHDFHRFGCLPPSPKYEKVFCGGPITLTAKKGSAVMVFTPQGPKLTVTGDSSIKGDRPLYNQDGLFFDEDSKRYVPLNRILDDFLSAVPKVIAEFESYHQRK